MANYKILVFVALIGMTFGSDASENDLIKRGAGKPNSINAIPTGAQKQDYSYNTYAVNANNQAQAYQSQIPNSFYPAQTAVGHSYYQTTANYDPLSLYHSQALVPPPAYQPLPYNFIQSPGFQPKIQLVPAKAPNGNIQFALVQTPSILPSAYIYSQPYISNGFNLQQNPALNAFPQGQIPQPNQQAQISQPYAANSQQSPMFLVAQPNPSIYSNNLLYQNAVPNLYNQYYQESPQLKYITPYASVQSQPNQAASAIDYEKVQPPQGTSKEDNEVSISNDYLTPAESNANYKGSYASSNRSPYKN